MRRVTFPAGRAHARAAHAARRRRARRARSRRGCAVAAADRAANDRALIGRAAATARSPSRAVIATPSTPSRTTSSPRCATTSATTTSSRSRSGRRARRAARARGDASTRRAWEEIRDQLRRATRGGARRAHGRDRARARAACCSGTASRAPASRTRCARSRGSGAPGATRTSSPTPTRCSGRSELPPHALLRRAAARDGEPRWRLLVLEDAGELLAADARAVAGQALSRLLNVTDGLLGEGLRAVVLVTTNEPLRGCTEPSCGRGAVGGGRVRGAERSTRPTSGSQKHGMSSTSNCATPLAELFAVAAGRAPLPRTGLGFAA